MDGAPLLRGNRSVRRRGRAARDGRAGGRSGRGGHEGPRGERADAVGGQAGPSAGRGVRDDRARRRLPGVRAPGGPAAGGVVAPVALRRRRPVLLRRRVLRARGAPQRKHVRGRERAGAPRRRPGRQRRIRRPVPRLPAPVVRRLGHVPRSRRADDLRPHGAQEPRAADAPRLPGPARGVDRRGARARRAVLAGQPVRGRGGAVRRPQQPVPVRRGDARLRARVRGPPSRGAR